MGSKKRSKTPPIDRAVPTLRKPKTTDVEKVQATRSTTQGMQSSASWAAATDVQGAVKIWNTNADDLEANAKEIAKLKDQLKTAEAKQRTLRRDWQASTGQVLSTVKVFCAGSADLVKGFNIDVLTHTVMGALGAPENLAVSPGMQPGDVVAAWAKGNARHGFVVQYATDVANTATYSAQMPCTKRKFTATGLPSGTVVHFRVAAIDPTVKTGVSPFSTWVAGTVK